MFRHIIPALLLLLAWAPALRADEPLVILPDGRELTIEGHPTQGIAEKSAAFREMITALGERARTGKVPGPAQKPDNQDAGGPLLTLRASGSGGAQTANALIDRYVIEILLPSQRQMPGGDHDIALVFDADPDQVYTRTIGMTGTTIMPRNPPQWHHRPTLQPLKTGWFSRTPTIPTGQIWTDYLARPVPNLLVGATLHETPAAQRPALAADMRAVARLWFDENPDAMALRLVPVVGDLERSFNPTGLDFTALIDRQTGHVTLIEKVATLNVGFADGMPEKKIDQILAEPLHWQVSYFRFEDDGRGSEAYRAFLLDRFGHDLLDVSGAPDIAFLEVPIADDGVTAGQIQLTVHPPGSGFMPDNMIIRQ